MSAIDFMHRKVKWTDERDGQTRDKVNTMGCKLQSRRWGREHLLYSSFNFSVYLKIFRKCWEKGGKKKKM